MSTSIPEDNDSDKQLPDILSDFEDRLRELPISEVVRCSIPNSCAPGLVAERRDRLMYDSGYAAALSQFRVQLKDQGKNTRRKVLRWQTLAVAMSVLFVAWVGLQTSRWPDAPPPLAVVDESNEEPTPQTTKPSQQFFWHETSSDLAQTTKKSLGPFSVMALRSNWMELEAAPPSRPSLHEKRPENSFEPPLRAADYRRLLEQI